MMYQAAQNAKQAEDGMAKTKSTAVKQSKALEQDNLTLTNDEFAWLMQEELS